MADEIATVELTLQRPRRGNPLRDLSTMRSVEELPPYIAEVVAAVAQGIQTSREFARVQKISISNASERFRVARQLGWIVPANRRYYPREGIRYTLNPSKSLQ